MVAEATEQVPCSRVGQTQLVGEVTSLDRPRRQRPKDARLDIGDGGARPVGRDPVALARAPC